MAKRFSERILEYIHRPDYQPLRTHKLAAALGISDAEMGDFHDAVSALRRLGRVIIGSKNAVMPQQAPGSVVGTYRGNPRGFGFVVPDEATEHGDLYIPPGESADAVTGDRVQCSILKRGKRDGKQAFGGRIIKVLERGESKFVGTLTLEENVWFVAPDGNTLHGPILIGDPHSAGARSGDSVIVEIVQYPKEGLPARGVITQRLGQRGEPGVDLAGIIAQFHLPDAFPEEVTEETRRIVREFNAEDAAAQREDLSRAAIITIDPDDARDYDDAISLERVHDAEGRASGPGGRTDAHWQPTRRKHGPPQWELGVHIADVSAFVLPDSALDREARKRGTSVYLPGRVLPMLPEMLSNGLCSLQEAQPRLCKSAFIRYDAEGRVASTRFANTLIRSRKRLTYRQAQAAIDGDRAGLDSTVMELLQRMNKLALAIRKRRIADGMIVLDLPAVELIYDAEGRVVDARPEDNSFTHTLIEMFMVEANEAVARVLASVEAPFLRRVHPPPDEESVEAMTRYLRAAGMALPKKPEPRDLQAVLADLKGKPEAHAVNLAVLKSMSMAVYAPTAIGHFALASEDYAHFTSPIRRYPDLMVHRLLDLFLDGSLPWTKKRGARKPPTYVEQTDLVEFGKVVSNLSRRAESAERELKMLKVLALLDRQIGESFDGVVTGVANFGLFIQHPKYLVDGLIRFEDLGDDWWEVDTTLGRVKGERSGMNFALGSRLRVTIAEVNLAMRQLTLHPAESLGRGKGRSVGAAGRISGRNRPSASDAGADSRRRDSGRSGPSGGGERPRGAGGRAGGARSGQRGPRGGGIGRGGGAARPAKGRTSHRKGRGGRKR